MPEFCEEPGCVNEPAGCWYDEPPTSTGCWYSGEDSEVCPECMEKMTRGGGF